MVMNVVGDLLGGAVAFAVGGIDIGDAQGEAELGREIGSNPIGCVERRLAEGEGDVVVVGDGRRRLLTFGAEIGAFGEMGDVCGSDGCAQPEFQAPRMNRFDGRPADRQVGIGSSSSGFGVRAGGQEERAKAEDSE